MPEYDVFISYRREGGDTLSQLLYTRLSMDGYRVFYDVEVMGPGKFNEQILRAIENSAAVIAVLPPNGLDRCKNEGDWVRRELEYAVARGKLLIPVMMKGFAWPADLPEGLKELPYYQGIPAEFNGVFDTWYERLKSYIPGKPKAKNADGYGPEEEDRDYEWGLIALEDGDRERAKEIFNGMLQRNVRCARAWLGLAMADEKISQESELENASRPLEENRNFIRALRYADKELKARLQDLSGRAKRRFAAELTEKTREAHGKKRAEEEKAPDEGAAEGKRPEERFAPDGYVRFGRYPQTDTGTDSTPVEWRVLAREGNRALVISRYGLDTKPYNDARKNVTWETCTLRKWLNGDFINAAFTERERSAILTTEVDNSRAQGYSGYDADGGNDTRDRVFLLSCAEVIGFFAAEYYEVPGSGANRASRVGPTAYAVSRGVKAAKGNETADGAKAAWWWLRSVGSYQSNAAHVRTDGSFSSTYVSYPNGCVRPALGVDTENAFFGA